MNAKSLDLKFEILNPLWASTTLTKLMGERDG